MECTLNSYYFIVLLYILIDTICLYSICLKYWLYLNFRSWNILNLDISKQVFSSFINLILNFLFLTLYDKDGNNCSNYLILYISDFCLLTPILGFIIYNLKKTPFNLVIYTSEDYKDYNYIIKTSQYNIIFIFLKLVINFSFVYPFLSQWNNISIYMFKHLSVNTQYILVTTIIPFLFNLNRYWIIDELLKGRVNYFNNMKNVELNLCNDYAEL